MQATSRLAFLAQIPATTGNSWPRNGFTSGNRDDTVFGSQLTHFAEPHLRASDFCFQTIVNRGDDCRLVDCGCQASGWASALRATSPQCPRRRQPSVYTAVTSPRLNIDIAQRSEVVNAIPFKKVAGTLRVPSARTRKAMLVQGCGRRSVPATFNN